MDERELKALLNAEAIPPADENARKGAINLALAAFDDVQRDKARDRKTGRQGFGILRRLTGRSHSHPGERPMKTRLMYGGMATALAVVLTVVTYETIPVLQEEAAPPAPGRVEGELPATRRIGVLLPLTGPFAKNGIENWEAMQIARDMINERGGVNGQKIEFVNGDATSPAAAISETERLITKEGIKITTGSFASPLAIAVSQAAERHGVFHWETTGAAEVITRRGFKHTFQVGAPARRYGQVAVDFVTEDLSKQLKKPIADLRIALLWENRAFGKSVGDGIRAYTESKKIKLVYDEG